MNQNLVEKAKNIQTQRKYQRFFEACLENIEQLNEGSIKDYFHSIFEIQIEYDQLIFVALQYYYSYLPTQKK